MYMAEGLDTGDILLEERIDIAPDETGGSLHERLGQIAPHALQKALLQLQQGSAPRVSQDSSAATYARKSIREDGRIDWAESAAMIERKIRAYDPWPGTYAIVRNGAGAERKLKIFSARVIAVEGEYQTGRDSRH